MDQIAVRHTHCDRRKNAYPLWLISCIDDIRLYLSLHIGVHGPLCTRGPFAATCNSVSSRIFPDEVTPIRWTVYGLASGNNIAGVWAVDHLLSNSTRLKYPKLAAGIVEGFDVFKDSGSLCLPVRPGPAIQQLSLQGSKETLRHRIIQGISYFSHGPP